MTVPVRRAYVEGPFGQVHYRHAEPDGEPRTRPLVGFHQSPLSSRMYEPFLARMGADRVAIAFDTPGYGDSDPPPRQLSIAEYAEAHGKAIDALGIDGELDLVGIHTGSRMAVELALQRPERVRHLLLVGASCYNAEERESQRKWTKDLVKPTERDDEGEQVQSMWKAWSSLRWDDLSDEMLERCLSDQLRDRSRAFAALEAVFAHDLTERLPLQQPTLVINVRDDIYEACKRSEALLKRGKLVDLSPAGFGVVEAWPERVAELARAHFVS